MAAVQARTWLSAVDIVAAKMDARIIPMPIAGIVSIANIGRPSSGSKSLELNKTRLANPIKVIKIMNGVCQTKNQTMACFRSLSVSRVIILETTCGCPATANPPKKNAKTHIEKPNIRSGGIIFVKAGSCEYNPASRPPNPPTFPNAIQQRISEPTIITHD